MSILQHTRQFMSNAPDDLWKFSPSSRQSYGYTGTRNQNLEIFEILRDSSRFFEIVGNSLWNNFD